VLAGHVDEPRPHIGPAPHHREIAAIGSCHRVACHPGCRIRHVGVPDESWASLPQDQDDPGVPARGMTGQEICGYRSLLNRHGFPTSCVGQHTMVRPAALCLWGESATKVISMPSASHRRLGKRRSACPGRMVVVARRTRRCWSAGSCLYTGSTGARGDVSAARANRTFRNAAPESLRTGLQADRSTVSPRPIARPRRKVPISRRHAVGPAPRRHPAAPPQKRGVPRSRRRSP